MKEKNRVKKQSWSAIRFGRLLLVGVLVILQACTPKTTGEGNEKISILFSQNAESGMLKLDPDGDYILMLQDVSDVTIAFADRPVRKAFMVDTESFISAFTWIFADTPPNAVLNFTSTVDGGQIDIAVFVLSEPSYDSNTKTLTYRAEDIPLDGEFEAISSYG